MSESSDTAGPWGAPAPETPAAPEAQPAPAGPRQRAPASPLQTLIWNVVSTLLLAGWITWQMGWLWAVAAIVGVFVHETGHVLVINWAGSGPSRIRIIPFFGGAATMTRPPASDFKGVLIALAGPVFGLLAALPFFGLADWTGRPGWLVGAFVIGAINLLNLAPAPPLDGSKALGPLLARVHPLLERVALGAVGGVAILWTLSRGSLLMPLFIALALFASLRSPQMRPPAEPLSWGQWAGGLALYLGALGLCAGLALYAAMGAGVGFNLGFGHFGFG
jgi:Zn-dependent protease